MNLTLGQIKDYLKDNLEIELDIEQCGWGGDADIKAKLILDGETIHTSYSERIPNTGR